LNLAKLKSLARINGSAAAQPHGNMTVSTIETTKDDRNDKRYDFGCRGTTVLSKSSRNCFNASGGR
jgi:hypothetical protein